MIKDSDRHLWGNQALYTLAAAHGFGLAVFALPLPSVPHWLGAALVVGLAIFFVQQDYTDAATFGGVIDWRAWDEATNGDAFWYFFGLLIACVVFVPFLWAVCLILVWRNHDAAAADREWQEWQGYDAARRAQRSAANDNRDAP